jgi:hypothetical protein
MSEPWQPTHFRKKPSRAILPQSRIETCSQRTEVNPAHNAFLLTFHVFRLRCPLARCFGRYRKGKGCFFVRPHNPRSRHASMTASCRHPAVQLVSASHTFRYSVVQRNRCRLDAGRGAVSAVGAVCAVCRERCSLARDASSYVLRFTFYALGPHRVVIGIAAIPDGGDLGIWGRSSPLSAQPERTRVRQSRQPWGRV